MPVGRHTVVDVQLPQRAIFTVPSYLVADSLKLWLKRLSKKELRRARYSANPPTCTHDQDT